MPVLDKDSARVLPTRKAAFDRASEGARSLSRSHDPDPAAVAGERKDEGLIAEAESLGGDLVEPSREKKVRIGGLEPGIEDRARLPPQRFRHDPTSIPGDDIKGSPPLHQLAAPRGWLPLHFLRGELKKPARSLRSRISSPGCYNPVGMRKEKLVFEQLNPDACRTYFIGATDTREAALVDPVLGATEEYMSYLEEGGWSLRYVIDTHTHADHLSGGRLLSRRTGAEYAMHRKAGSTHASLRLTDGSTLSLGGTVLEAIETPGHTKDSVTLKLPGRSSPATSSSSAGRTNGSLPAGSGEHWESLNRDPSIDESTLIYPGHDYQERRESVCGREATNSNLVPRAREYVAWLSSMEGPRRSGWSRRSAPITTAPPTSP
jgi:glyoxylase-like metal-dependent hydrolase (beta-lactamase superfamily II)